MSKVKTQIPSFLSLTIVILFLSVPTLAYAQNEASHFNETESMENDQSNLSEESKIKEEQAVDRANNLITVNFENVDIRDVIRLLADKAQLNMVVGPTVTASINLQLTNVTWEQALEIITRTYGLAYKHDGELIRIMTLEQFQSEDEKVPLATKIVTLNFARASDIKSNFENMLSPRGKIDVNERLNSLIVTDIPDNITKIEEIAERLDNRTPQVMIEALMVDVVITQDDQLGINWNIQHQTHGAGATVERSFAQNLGALPALGGAISFGTTILTDKDLHATIAAWQQQSRVNILAHPQIMTLDNLAAKINLTEEIPYQQQTTSTESSSAVSTTSFKEAGITLSVTPHITTKDNYIYLNIDVKQSFQSRTTSDNQPVIDSRSAATNLLVKNRETAVIGGLRKKNDTFTVNKVPLLGDIPLIGSAFRQRVGSLSDTDLMIFVTPTIVGDIALTPKQGDRLGMFNEETEDWASKIYRPKKKTVKNKEEVISEESPAPSKTKPEGYFYLRPPLLNGEAK